MLQHLKNNPCQLRKVLASLRAFVVFVFHNLPSYALNVYQNGHPMPEEKDESSEANNANRQPDALSPAGPRLPVSPENPPLGNAQAQNCGPNPSEAQDVRRELHWLEILNFGGQIILAVVGIIGVCIYGRQLGVMQGQLDQMGKQSTEIQKQTTLARQQMEGHEAAQVDFRPIFFLNGKIYFDARNFGHVLSKRVTIDFDIFKQKVSDSIKVAPLGHSHREIVQMEPVPDSNRATPWDDSDRQNHWIEVWSLPLEELSVINHLDPKYTIIVAGTITYDDGFGQTYTKPIPCSAYVYMPAFVQQDGSIAGSYPEQKKMIGCSNYSFWIKQFLESVETRHMKRQPDTRQ